MYSLRFYLDDDDNVIKCEYKKIYDAEEADLPFNYNTIELSQEDLNEAFRILAKHDLNHESTVKKDYIIHEFVVKKIIMVSMIAKMTEYKKAQERDMFLNQRTKFNDIQFIDNKPKNNNKYKLNRRKKIIGKVVASILTIATLASITSIALKDAKGYNKSELHNEQPAIVQEYHIDEDDILSKYAFEERDKTHLENNNEPEKTYIDIDTIETQKAQEEPNMTKMVQEINHNLDENQFDYELDIAADDWTSTTKYVNCYNNYNDLVTKYAHMYGIDPKVALAIGCHERGEHSTVRDSGGAIGLFQIQVGVWDNNDVKAYNFETNSWETFNVTEDKLRDLETNIKVGMMIFQECLRRDDYNITMAVQEYNFGHGGLLVALNAASKTLGIPRETLEQKGNSEWFNFRTYNKSDSGFQYGDPNYVENVFKYINDGELLNFTTPDGEQITVKFHNLNSEMKMN